MKKKIRLMLQLNHSTLSSMRPAKSVNFSFTNKIFIKYGLHRRIGNFPALVLRLFKKFFNEPSGVSGLSSLGKIENHTSYSYVANWMVQRGRGLKSENRDNKPVLFNTYNSWTHGNNITYLNALHERIFPDWQNSRNYENLNPKASKVTNLLTGTKLLDRILHQDKNVLDKNSAPVIKHKSFIYNTRNISNSTILNTYKKASLRNQDKVSDIACKSEKKESYNVSKRFLEPQKGNGPVEKIHANKAVSSAEANGIEEKVLRIETALKNELPRALRSFNKSFDNNLLLRDEPSDKTGGSTGKSRIRLESLKPLLTTKSSIIDTIKEDYEIKESKITKKLYHVYNFEEKLAVQKSKLISGITTKREYNVQGLSEKLNGDKKQGKDAKAGKLTDLKQIKDFNPIVKTNSSFLKDSLEFLRPPSIKGAGNTAKVLADGIHKELVNQPGLGHIRREFTEDPNEAVREVSNKRRLVFRKPVTEGSIRGEEEQELKTIPLKEKEAASRTLTSPKQAKVINNIGPKEMNLLAERVFKILEKRIVIQKDRRGLL